MFPVPSTEAFDAWRHRPGFSWLFKHSRICPDSAAAYAEVAAYEKAHPGDVIGLIVVQDARDASNRAAAAFGVKHESPQLFLLRDGKVVWHASHDAVTQGAMEIRRLPGL
jgi:bacillithiol system protein YtxJ